MSVTVSGLSGLTNAYTSVLSATGSLEISGASRCDDIYLPRWLELARMGRWRDHPIARAMRAARSLSRRLVWFVPENTSMSPDFASRTCTTMGPAGAFAAPSAAGAAGRVLADAAWL